MTVDRLEMCNLLHTAAETTVLLFRGLNETSTLHASTQMMNLKGPSSEKDRKPGQLRYQMQPPNQVINFVHAADEPADVVRELGIFFARTEQQKILEEVKANWETFENINNLKNDIVTLESKTPYNPYILEDSIEKCIRSYTLSKEEEKILRDGAENKDLTWNQLNIMIPPEKHPDLVWDFLLIASESLSIVRQGDHPPELLPLPLA